MSGGSCSEQGISTQLRDTLSINIQKVPTGNEPSGSPNLIQVHENEAQGRQLNALQSDIGMVQESGSISIVFNTPN